MDGPGESNVTMFNSFGRYEDEFEQWKRSGYPGACEGTLAYITHLRDPEDDSQPRHGTMWPHQWDAFLRVVYAYEIRKEEITRPDGVLLNIVTGGGKTAIIAALMVWLRLAHDVKKFVTLCPNLIVRDRLEEDFQNGKVFVDRGLIPQDAVVTKDDFALTTLGSDRTGGWASLLGASVVLGNIHQFYESNVSGQGNLSALMNEGDFALFNDEAHNTAADEWDATLATLRPKTLLRVDTTATPDRADGQIPDSKMICEYLIQDALADRLVKTPVVYQPNIETVELTYRDARTGETRSVEEINWAEVDRRGINATQWVTDDKPMQQQMAIALARLREQERRAKRRYEPILFVVAVCKADAEKASKTLETHFRIKTLLVTEDSTEKERRQASELGRAKRSASPYKAVVSVLMLREGWDVPEVGVILLLRKFSSPVYGQQVIGRGLRRARVKGVTDNEPQICAVVDHPKLEHKWLWDIFGSKIRQNVGIDDTFDEKEDLPPPPPRQVIANPDRIIDIPDPNEDDDGEFDIHIPESKAEPLRNWRDALNGLSYPSETVEITNQEISGVEGRELGPEGWRMREAPAEFRAGEPVDVDLTEALKEELLAMAERLLEHAGYSVQHKGRLYRILLDHVRTKFLDGDSLGIAQRPRLEAVWRLRHKVEEAIRITPGLIAGMVIYGDE